MLHLGDGLWGLVSKKSLTLTVLSCPAFSDRYPWDSREVQGSAPCDHIIKDDFVRRDQVGAA